MKKVVSFNLSFNLFGYCKFICTEMIMPSMILKIWSRICHLIKTKQVMSFVEAMQSTASKKTVVMSLDELFMFLKLI